MVRYLTMIGRSVRPEVSKDERGRRRVIAKLSGEKGRPWKMFMQKR